MKKTSKELLNFFHLKLGDIIKIEHYENNFKVVYEGDNPEEDFALYEVNGNLKESLCILTDIEYEVINTDLLTSKEREYLSNVIKPFRDRVDYIQKLKYYINSTREFIKIQLTNKDFVLLPHFEENTMYKGMEVDKKYTLDELGL